MMPLPCRRGLLAHRGEIAKRRRIAAKILLLHNSLKSLAKIDPQKLMFQINTFNETQQQFEERRKYVFGALTAGSSTTNRNRYEPIGCAGRNTKYLSRRYRPEIAWLRPCASGRQASFSGAGVEALRRRDHRNLKRGAEGFCAWSTQCRVIGNPANRVSEMKARVPGIRVLFTSRRRLKQCAAETISREATVRVSRVKTTDRSYRDLGPL